MRPTAAGQKYVHRSEKNERLAKQASLALGRIEGPKYGSSKILLNWFRAS